MVKVLIGIGIFFLNFTLLSYLVGAFLVSFISFSIVFILGNILLIHLISRSIENALSRYKKRSVPEKKHRLVCGDLVKSIDDAIITYWWTYEDEDLAVSYGPICTECVKTFPILTNKQIEALNSRQTYLEVYELKE